MEEKEEFKIEEEIENKNNAITEQNLQKLSVFKFFEEALKRLLKTNFIEQESNHSDSQLNIDQKIFLINQNTMTVEDNDFVIRIILNITPEDQNVNLEFDTEINKLTTIMDIKTKLLEITKIEHCYPLNPKKLNYKFEINMDKISYSQIIEQCQESKMQQNSRNISGQKNKPNPSLRRSSQLWVDPPIS